MNRLNEIICDRCGEGVPFPRNVFLKATRVGEVHAFAEVCERCARVIEEEATRHMSAGDLTTAPRDWAALERIAASLERIAEWLAT